MKRQWKVLRRFQVTGDPQRRWDHSCQHLLEWAQPNKPDSVLLPSFQTPAEAEVKCEERDLSAGIDNRQTQAQTIDQQLERLRRHLDLQGEPLLADNVFRDGGFSGANLNSPGLDRLRDRVKSGVVDRVLLTSPDQLARHYVHQMVLIEEWEHCGCKVEFLDRPMSQDPHDQLLLQIRGGGSRI